MKCKFGLFLAVIVAFGFCPRSSAQNGSMYDDSVNKFKILMIGDWRAVSYSDAVGRPKTDFVYRDRSEGLLKISHESLGKRSLTEFLQDEEDAMRISRAAFEMGSVEDCAAGDLHGSRMAYFYKQGSQGMAVTNYFFKDDDQIWELRFIGKRGIVDEIRNITDAMARSFRPYQ